MPPRTGNIGGPLAIAGAIAVAGFTLSPSSPASAAASARTPITCLVCGDHGVVDVVLNLVLFLPFGFGLGLAGWSWRRASAAAALLSFTVEALQFVIPGRDPSLGDLLNNTIGGGFGAVLAGLLPRLARPAPALAVRLLLGGTGAWLGVMAVSAWALSPGAKQGQLIGTWGHPEAEPFPFAGEVRSVVLGGVAMPKDGEPPDAAAVRQQLERGEVKIAATLVSGPPPSRGSWIYTIKVDGKPQLALAQEGRDAGITVPARALRVRLHAPVLSLPHGYPPVAGVPVAIEGGRGGGRMWLESSYGGRRRTIEIELSPAHGWVLIAPFNFPLGPGLRLITAGWLALFLLPLGHWGGQTARPMVAAGILGGALAAGLGALPAVTGFAPVHWSEWVAAGMAVAGGWALRRLAAYLQLRCGSPSTSESFSS